MSTESKRVIYNLPLSEHVRSMLRLSNLFSLFRRVSQHPETWASHTSLNYILDLVELLNRSDIKKELIKELDLQIENLHKFLDMPEVDQNRLNAAISDIKNIQHRIQDIDGKPGASLSEYDILSTLQQKRSSPGTTTSADFPAFHYWLNRPYSERLTDLKKWFSCLETIEEAVRIVTQMIYDSGSLVEATASAGFFQQDLGANHPVKLIQVSLPATVNYYPEISGSKYRFTIRFMHNDNKATQVQEDIEFGLTICAI